jgi:hypothetical protein
MVLIWIRIRIRSGFRKPGTGYRFIQNLYPDPGSVNPDQKHRLCKTVLLRSCPSPPPLTNNNMEPRNNNLQYAERSTVCTAVVLKEHCSVRKQVRANTNNNLQYAERSTVCTAAVLKEHCSVRKQVRARKEKISLYPNVFKGVKDLCKKRRV